VRVCGGGCICMCVCMCVRENEREREREKRCVFVSNLHCLSLCVSISLFVYEHMYVYINIYIFIYTYMYTHIWNTKHAHAPITNLWTSCPFGLLHLSTSISVPFPPSLFSNLGVYLCNVCVRLHVHACCDYAGSG